MEFRKYQHIERFGTMEVEGIEIGTSKIKIDPFNNKITLKPFKVVSSSAWMDFGGYAARKMLLPASHVAQTITLCGSRKEIKVTM